MTNRVAINRYGRIGRNILRAYYEGGEKNDIQAVAINDLGNPQSNAHLSHCDTAHGKFPASSNFDATLTKLSGCPVKVSFWYDDEWSFSNRMLDTTVAPMAAK